jgi:hypothetical protein
MAWLRGLSTGPLVTRVVPAPGCGGRGSPVVGALARL